MKSILTKFQILSFLCALPALANDVGLHNSSAQPTRANVPPQDVPVMIAQANQPQQISSNSERSVGVCHVVPNVGPLPPPGEDLEYNIGPVDEAKAYFRLYEHLKVVGTANTSILQNPKHGVLRDDGSGSYSYLPNPEYLGKDSATMLVEIDGFKVKVVYSFRAINGHPDGDYEKELCPNKVYRWKISSVLDANGNSLRGLG
jgi:hypothetical protein